MSISIVPITDEHVPAFHALLDVVARERKYLAMVQAPPLKTMRKFVGKLRTFGPLQWVAVDDSLPPARAVVGWCDITPDDREGFRHGGRLGIGVHPDYRGNGIGSRLVETVIDSAFKNGFERVELEVFASNAGAIRLYERLGFEREGIRRRVRKLDGCYDDNFVMTRLRDDSRPPP